jgi:phosphoglycolate phosphatase/putative hydrolase of the HAD superfamily
MTHAAWLVDLDGTLYAAPALKLAMAAELCLRGLPQLGRIRAFRRAHEELREEQLECGGDPYRVQLERAARACGTAPAELEACVREWMIERPCRWLPYLRRRRLLAEIEAFRRAGGRTALVSDYPARRKLRALRAEACFEVVVANGEPGGPTRLKPAPEGYLAAARALGVEPGACLVIGDRADADGLAAARAGMDFRKV